MLLKYLLFRNSLRINNRKMYISKNTGFPLRMELPDNTVVTITDIEIDDISETQFDLPAGAKYTPDNPMFITGGFDNRPF